MFNKKTNEPIGGASLVNPKVLITAAHLLEIKKSENSFTKMKPEDLKVRCGDWDLGSSTKNEQFRHDERDVDVYTFHPFYSGQKKRTAIRLRNDVALIHTKEEFVVGKPNINPICLPTIGKPTIDGLCSSMGWGVNSARAIKGGTTIMKQTNLQEITDRKECYERILNSGKVPKVWKLDDSWICARPYKNETEDNFLCKGDGGGPLVCQESGGINGKERHVLSGIIVAGVGCGEVETPDIFSSVHEALCFIDFDVKCKHGNRYRNHFDYTTKCASWYDDELSWRVDFPSNAFKKEERKLKRLAGTCRPIVEEDIDCFA